VGGATQCNTTKTESEWTNAKKKKKNSYFYTAVSQNAFCFKTALQRTDLEQYV